MKNRSKKGIAQVISLMLAAIVVACVIPQTAGTVLAAGDKTITGLGTGAIANPNSGAGGWSYVYYGSYNGSNVKYRVLDKDADEYGGNTLLLDCDNMFQSMGYDADGDSWGDSDLYAWLNGSNFLGSDDVFTGIERSAITSSYKNGASSSDGVGFQFFDENNVQQTCSFQSLTGEKIFVLDAMETSNASYGYTSGNSAKLQNGVSAGWWLRSNFSKGDTKYAVARQDDRDGYDARNGSHGVSPAFNVNLSSVIFSSLISGTAGASGAEYKLTLKDSDMSVSVTEGSDITRDGAVITVPYTISGSNAGNATQVSVVIKDGEWNLGTSVTSGYTYLKLDTESFGTSGTGTFTMPEEYADKELGTDYFIYLLAEDVNSGNETDYASAPVSITIPPVSRGNRYNPVPPSASNGGDTEPTFDPSADDNSGSDPASSTSNGSTPGQDPSSSNGSTPGQTPSSSNGDASEQTSSSSEVNTPGQAPSTVPGSSTVPGTSADVELLDDSEAADSKQSEAPDFYDDLRLLIKIAIEKGGEQTVYYSKGNKLPFDIMKTLEDNPQITVVYKYSYSGKEYTANIAGRKVKTEIGIYWYGPLYLNQHFGEWTI